ncbi:MAG TPA: LAGLIDADG family homing endonuclease, partial [Thermoleophilaceae bacterium]|nr:LAGLIDADG family homing endonuclease [Thermoleophilaceae bacterium]
MRWDNLKVDAEESRTLPGYREPATVRTFEAPEALDTRFYEVRSKSALNKVPKQSRMPFRWTINPYRGCSHGCSYCQGPETPILMADGRTKQLGDLRVGETIYGTTRVDTYRDYTHTHVAAHWATIKPAYRIVLEDGTELIASGDHRFLSDRGWKFVTGAEQGALRRPHLTTNNKLMGTGSFAQQPVENDDYRRGYLCGMVRGDGHLGSYSYNRVGRTHGDVHRFRLALADLDGLRRARQYLETFAVKTREFAFYSGTKHHRPITTIGAQSYDRVTAIRELICWPRSPSDDWCKGFLAGIFDAEGGCSEGILRISNTDSEILDWTAFCLRRFRFCFAIEHTKNANGLKVLRLRGGLPEQLRFLHSVDPAITRKRSIVE